MSTHLGRRVSDLLDGQLGTAETEAAWAHVHACHLCRDQVEREGWVKTRLTALTFDAGCAPDRLKGALLGLPPGDCYPGSVRQPAAPGQHDLTNRARPRRVAGVAALGGGAVGAAVVGILALGTAPADAPSFDRRQLSPQTTQVSPGPVAPRGAVRLQR